MVTGKGRGDADGRQLLPPSERGTLASGGCAWSEPRVRVGFLVVPEETTGGAAPGLAVDLKSITLAVGAGRDALVRDFRTLDKSQAPIPVPLAPATTPAKKACLLDILEMPPLNPAILLALLGLVSQLITDFSP
jgi:hypothetical protein